MNKSELKKVKDDVVSTITDSTLKSVDIDISIPYVGGIKGTWVPNNQEELAAWELYVELITRISVVPLEKNEGLLREALSSLYSLFNTTRSILKKYGPSIARPQNNDSELSLGLIAVTILNYVLRPLLSKWHPILSDYESSKPENISAASHEGQWEQNQELRTTLDETRAVLIQYSKSLAKVAGVPSLTKDIDEL